VHLPPSPARTDFTLITECTPKSSGFNSVYSVGGIAGLEKEIVEEENKRLRRHCLSDSKPALKSSGGGGL